MADSLSSLQSHSSPPEPAEAVEYQQRRNGRQSGQAQDFADRLADGEVPEL